MTKKPTLRQHYLTYMGVVRNCLTKGSQKLYFHTLEKFLKRFPDKKFPEEFHRYDMLEYREVRLREGIRPSTINMEIAVVGAFWSWMFSKEIVPYNPTTELRRLKVPEKAPKALSSEYIRTLLGVCETLDDKLLVLLPLTTGVRAVEMERITWDSIDWDNGLLVLDGPQTKTQRQRTVPLREDVLGLLREKHTASPDIFGIEARSIRARFRVLCIKAGLPNKGLHSLRRTFATMLHRAGVELNSVRELLGHANLATTALYLEAAGAEALRPKLDALPRLT